MQVKFGDIARVLSTDETEKRGVAGKIGTVYGETLPSSSGVSDIVGDPKRDRAYNVFFDDLDEGFWFADNLIELVESNPNTKSWIGLTVEELENES